MDTQLDTHSQFLAEMMARVGNGKFAATALHELDRLAGLQIDAGD